jgi:hypothetical protein
MSIHLSTESITGIPWNDFPLAVNHHNWPLRSGGDHDCTVKFIEASAKHRANLEDASFAQLAFALILQFFRAKRCALQR